MHGASGRQILGQRAPLAAGAQNVHHAVDTSRIATAVCRRRACPAGSGSICAHSALVARITQFVAVVAGRLSAVHMGHLKRPAEAPHNADQQDESVDNLDDPLEILEGGGDKPRLTPIIEPGERIPCA